VSPVATRSRSENDSGVDAPDTRYAKTVDGLSIAYQVLGCGPVDLVFTPWGEVLERHHELVRAMLARYRGQEVDTAGDGFFATFDGPARAARCATAIVEGVRPLGIQVRAGVHTGGVDTIAGKVGGLGVVIGSRVGALAGASEVLVSQTVKDLVAGSGLVFEEAGERELKGVPELWRLYRVVT